MSGLYPDLSHVNEGPPYPVCSCAILRSGTDSDEFRPRRCVRCHGDEHHHRRRRNSSGSEEGHGPWAGDRKCPCVRRGSDEEEEYHGPFKGAERWCGACETSAGCGCCKAHHEEARFHEDGARFHEDEHIAERCRHEFVDVERGQNYVMQRERVEDVIYDLEKGKDRFETQ